MGLFLDFFPLLAFLVAFKLFNIYVATKALMAASVLQVLVSFAWKRKVERIHLITLVLALALGAATLWLHDARFIKWKPTAVLWLLGGVIVARRMLQKDHSIKQVMVKISPELGGVPEKVWRRIDWVWGVAMIVAGCANLVIAYALALDVWVMFKVFGITAVNLALVIYTVIEVQKHQPPEPEPVVKAAEPAEDDSRR